MNEEIDFFCDLLTEAYIRKLVIGRMLIELAKRDRENQ